MSTTPKIVFGATEFEGEDFLSAKLTEEFSPLCITLPISQLDFELYSDDVNFSIINPTGAFEAMAGSQALALYEVVDGQQRYLGQFYLVDWSNRSENVKSFVCFDVLGILDKYSYLGGIWLTAVTIGELVADVLEPMGVEYEVDPDVAALELTGWLPIMSRREALQQIAFAAGAYVLSARRSSIVMGRLSQVSITTSGIRTGVAHTGQTRVYQMRWRGNQSIVFSTGGAVTRGIRSGVAHGGQTRIWQKRWRVSQWDGVRPVIDILDEEQARRKVTLRPQVTGVEVTGHDIIEGAGSLELLNQSLAAGTHEIHFGQPMHDLVVSGATISESGANYAILEVAVTGAVVLSGQVYISTDTLYGEYLPEDPNRKENIIKITDATLINSSNGATICRAVFDYYQQRYKQEFRMFAPSQYAEVGATVNVETLYTNYLYGVIEKMTTDLASGCVADTEVVGIIT